MSTQNQKEAVFNAVMSVLSENGVSVNEQSNIGSMMTRSLRSQVNQILFEGFRSGSIVLEKELDDSKLKNYVSGLQSNWLRKDKRLNGNTNYVAKNPGSKVGSQDPTIKAMRALMTTLSSPADKLEIQAAIDARLVELNATKQKNIIDISSLPEDIKAKFIK